MSGSVLEIARRVAAEIEARNQTRAISVADVLQIFPGARVCKPDQQTLPCVYCGGKMTERLERRRHVLACLRCGRTKK
jgi:hypothetical protein